MKSILGRLSLLLFIMSFSATSKATTLKNYDIEEISVQPLKTIIHRTGRLAFKRTINLSFKSSGYLSKLSVDEGDYFEKDQILAAMDVSELVEHKNAAYAQLMQAKIDVNRIQKLIEQKLSSEQAIDLATTKLKTTRAAYKVAFYNLEKAQVIAPFSGVVLARYADFGELMSPGQISLKVAALKNNWVVKVALTGTEVSQVRLKQKVKIRLHALGMVEGVISKIPIISNAQGHLFMIDVLLPELLLTDGVIAGQIAEVIMEFTSEDVVYQLPIEALMTVDEEGKAVVAAKTGNEKLFTKHRYDIYKLNNQYIYLHANNDDQPIQIVTSGWQNITDIK